MKGKSFALNPLKEEQVVFSLIENHTEIWHKRLGHYHHQALLQLSEKRLVLDVPMLEKKNVKLQSLSIWRAK